MIIRLWDYRKATKGLKGGAATASRTRNIAEACGRYVTGIALPSDLAKDLQAIRTDAATGEAVGRYIASSDDPGERILATYINKLPPGSLDDQTGMFATYAASAGIERLRHMVFSYRDDEEVDPRTMAKHRKIIAKVMRIETCPSMGADHGDTDNPHGHIAVVAVDAQTCDPVPFGQGWWKEACQIAIARCEYVSDLRPEPGRRYVADRTGVYQVATDIRVADAEGTLVAGQDTAHDPAAIRQIMITVDKAAKALREGNDAPEGIEPGAEWDMRRAVQVLATPRVEKARSWCDVHHGLARVGLEYVRVAGGGRIEARGHGDDPAGRTIASSVIGRAGRYSEMERRFGEYEPAPCDIEWRPFVMPRYNAPTKTEEDLHNAELKRETMKRKDELDAEMCAANRRKQGEIHQLRRDELAAADKTSKQRINDKANSALRVQAAKAKNERAILKDVARAAGAQLRRSPSKWNHEHPVYAAIGAASAAEPAGPTADLEPCYRIRKSATHRTYETDTPAFVETDTMVALRSYRTRDAVAALRLAGSKFGELTLIASRIQVERLAKLSAELGLVLHSDQRDDAQRHADAVQADPAKSLIQRAVRRASALVDLKALREPVRSSRRERWELHRLLTPQRLEELRYADRKPDRQPRPMAWFLDPLNQANYVVDKLDRNRMTLPSTRHGHRGDEPPYLDDAYLREQFRGREHVLVREDMQRKLRALELIQRHERAWVCDALQNGRARLEDGSLVVDHPEDKWAVAFHAAQKADPQYQRLIAVSRARPERFRGASSTNPIMATWLDLHAQGPKNEDFRVCVANALFHATSHDERHALFERYPHLAQDLRDTRGHFGDEYRNKIYRRPDQNDKSWQKTWRIVELNDRRSRGR